MSSLTNVGSGSTYSSQSLTLTSTGNSTSSTGGSSVSYSSTPGYDDIIDIGNSLQELGLSTPLSASDVAAMLGEISQDLQQTLATNSEDSSLSEADSTLSEIAAEATQVQTYFAQIAAAQTAYQNDETGINTGLSTIESDYATIGSNDTTIDTDQSQISSGATNSSQLQTAVTTLQDENAQLTDTILTDIVAGTALESDAQTQTENIATYSADITSLESGISALTTQYESEIAATANQSSEYQDAQTNISNVINNQNATPNSLIDANLQTSQDQTLVQNDLDPNTQAALALLGSVGAALAAIAALGTTAANSSNASPQQVSGSSTVVG